MNGKIGFVSLGCAKALYDSEIIITRLRAEGYELTDSYDSADCVVINTCGFLDSAKEESFAAIAEAINENGKAIVTGCLGVFEEEIKKRYPKVAHICGPADFTAVMNAVHDILPPNKDISLSLIPKAEYKLTPKHYAYLKISEGCNHSCRFCIIPNIRGKQISRPMSDIIKEAEALSISGVKELMIIAQDTGDWGSDLPKNSDVFGKSVQNNIYNLCKELGSLPTWIRLHYMYPWRYVDNLIELMADGLILPYLDMPLQHASPNILKDMRRPANQEKVLERIASWRKICPDISLRSTFIVGYPGESDEDFDQLIDFVEEARLDKVGTFMFEAVEGAEASSYENQIDEEVKQWRFDRLMSLQAEISEDKLKEKVGKSLEVVIDEIYEDELVCRSKYDAPEVDGNVIVNTDSNTANLKVGDRINAKVFDSDAYDLFATYSI